MLLSCGIGKHFGESLGLQGESKQSILKEISPEYSLEGPMLKLKLNLQYFGHLMWRVNSLKKTLMLGKTEGRRKRRRQRMGWLDDITDSMDMSLSKLQRSFKFGLGWWRTGKPGVLIVHRVATIRTQMSDETTNNNNNHLFKIKTFQKVGMKGTYLNIIKTIYDKTYS